MEQQQQQHDIHPITILNGIARLTDPRYREERHCLMIIDALNQQPRSNYWPTHLIDFLDNHHHGGENDDDGSHDDDEVIIITTELDLSHVTQLLLSDPVDDDSGGGGGLDDVLRTFLGTERIRLFYQSRHSM
jgi:hypothetical protein